jgi:peptidoglycan/LPS O-acetylase OafA/YrhL
VPFLRGLNGLRAVAILGVLFYHLGASWMLGGFLGVDVFFVISGFLITALLLTEYDRAGEIRLGRFYLRRARRLLPALLTVLVAIAAWTVVFHPQRLYGLRSDTLSAVAYISNWWFIAEDRSYFEVMAEPPLLAHLWSLAIEEQFYLVWPLVVLLVMRRGGRRPLYYVALGGAVLSTLLMSVLAVLGDQPVPHDPSRLYFGTDTHAFGLMAGAALAVVWTAQPPTSPVPALRRVFNLLGAVALATVVWAFVEVSEFSHVLYRGGFLAFCLAVAVLVAAAVYPGTLIERVMSLPPLQWIGDRSYGLYLWHWPVFLMLRPGIDIGLTGLPNAALRLLLTFGLAALTYRWVEAPFREGQVLTRLRRHLRPGPLPAVTRAVAPLLTSVLVTALAVSGLARATPSAVPQGQVQVAPVIHRGNGGVNQAGDDSSPRHPSPAPGQANGGNMQPDRRPPEGQRARIPPVLAMGDSVLIAASAALRAELGRVRVIAEVGMQAYELRDRLEALAGDGDLRRAVVLHTGSNGIIDPDDLRDMLKMLEDRPVVVVVNVSVPRTWEAPNDKLLDEIVPQYDNTVLADWKSETIRNRAHLGPDGVHPGATGAAAYSQLVKQALLEGLQRVRGT